MDLELRRTAAMEESTTRIDAREETEAGTSPGFVSSTNASARHSGIVVLPDRTKAM
jgi:hypothetical protein